jgi:hypothetical protein
MDAETAIRVLKNFDYGRLPGSAFDEWRAAAFTAGDLRLVDAVPHLAKAIDVGLQMEYGPNIDLLQEAAAILAEIGDPCAVPSLAAILESLPPDEVVVSFWVENALEVLGGRESHEALKRWNARKSSHGSETEW